MTLEMRREEHSDIVITKCGRDTQMTVAELREALGNLPQDKIVRCDYWHVEGVRYRHPGTEVELT